MSGKIEVFHRVALEEIGKFEVKIPDRPRPNTATSS
jgi:hypothetical protein